MARAHVQVLLSTFNGERFLPELLESVFAQTHTPISVLVRDDGSRDGTTAVLERWARNRDLVWYQGQHVGVGRSFFDLLAQADPDAAAFAFCDQDDVWLPDKLARTWRALETARHGEPVLYCSRAVVVDRHLKPIGLTALPRRGPSLANALVANIAPGCTMALNAAGRDVLLRRELVLETLHDAWAYLVIAALGRVVYDPEPSVLYRQHAGNTIGAANPRWRRRLGRLRTLGRRAPKRMFLENAFELERLYGPELDAERGQLLRRFLNHPRGIVSAMKYALSGEVYRQTRIDDLVLRALIALRQL